MIKVVKVIHSSMLKYKTLRVILGESYQITMSKCMVKDKHTHPRIIWVLPHQVYHLLQTLHTHRNSLLTSIHLWLMQRLYHHLYTSHLPHQWQTVSRTLRDSLRDQSLYLR
jgi:hypothetical protein